MKIKYYKFIFAVVPLFLFLLFSFTSKAWTTTDLPLWIGETNGEIGYEFNRPHGLTSDDEDNIYILDAVNHRVQKYNSNLDFLLSFGSLGTNPGEFTAPRSISFNRSNSLLYVLDTANNRVQVFDKNGNYISQWGSFGTTTGQFRTPSGIGTDINGNILVSDTLNHRIQVFDSYGNFLYTWGINGNANGQFINPYSVTVDNDNNVYVSDTANNRVQKFAIDGTYISQWGTVGSAEGQFSGIRGIYADEENWIYLADFGNARIQVFDTNGNFLQSWGSLGANPGEFNGPRSIIRVNDYLFVSDTENHRIQKFVYDRVAPIINIDQVDDIFISNFDNPIPIIITGNVEDSYSNITSVQIQYIDNNNQVSPWEDCTINNSNSTSSNFTCNIALAGNLSPYTIYVRATDSFTNTNTTINTGSTYDIASAVINIALNLSNPPTLTNTGNNIVVVTSFALFIIVGILSKNKIISETTIQ
jgi:sugar lactone lactonase YvrE